MRIFGWILVAIGGVPLIGFGLQTIGDADTLGTAFATLGWAMLGFGLAILGRGLVGLSESVDERS